MAGNFESSEWIRAVADIVAAPNGKAAATGLTDAIDAVVEHEGTALIAFHRNARPDVMHHTLEPAGKKHYLDRYLEGPYLLDPLFQLAVRCRSSTLCRFRDRHPDRFRSSEYYRQYCERTHLQDEMDFFTAVSDLTTVVLVIGRRTRMFAKSEVRRLRIIEPLVHASIGRIWQAWSERSRMSGQRDDVHQRLTDCFDNFGRDVLTDRERQISQLLLRGHSSKSVARELDIAPGTVMVHKRNLFSKLGISSQFELFALFIDDLGTI